MGYQLQTTGMKTVIETDIVLFVLAAGLLLQMGVNLINDHVDLKNKAIEKKLTETDKKHIRFNYRIGWMCFMLCSLIGLHLASQVGVFLLLLAIIGGCGALFYTTEPINYKRRGLGVIFVFFFMGILMVYGSFYAVTGSHKIEVIIASLPISFLTSALLLSNEIRDYSNDKKEGIRTLTVRLGYVMGKRLYISCISLCFLSAILLSTVIDSWINLLLLAPTAFMSVNILNTINNTDQTPLPPKTGKLYLAFGISEIIILSL